VIAISLPIKLRGRESPDEPSLPCVDFLEEALCVRTNRGYLAGPVSLNRKISKDNQQVLWGFGDSENSGRPAEPRDFKKVRIFAELPELAGCRIFSGRREKSVFYGRFAVSGCNGGRWSNSRSGLPRFRRPASGL